MPINVIGNSSNNSENETDTSFIFIKTILEKKTLKVKLKKIKT